MVFIYSIASVLFVSLLSLIGIFTLSIKEGLLRKYAFILVSLAVGALLGDALLHLLPEALETSLNQTQTSLLVILGIFIFFILEKVLHFHHEDCLEGETPHPIGRLILIGDAVHNFIDGLVIAVGYSLSIEVGLATTFAVILHEIPQEIGDFGVLLQAGYTKKRALWLNFLSGLVSVFGVLVAYYLKGLIENFISLLLPLTAGGFIYIAMSSLILELHKNNTFKHSFIQLLSIGVGIGVALILK